jgi:hypothetical protein
VWRRIIVPESCTLGELHRIIRTVFGWHSAAQSGFAFNAGEFDLNTRIEDLETANTAELLYESGTKWTVRVMILSRQQTPGIRPVRCVAGAGAAPPEFIPGPVKFKRLLSALESGNEIERQAARQELGPDFTPGSFDLEACNRSLARKQERRL